MTRLRILGATCAVLAIAVVATVTAGGGPDRGTTTSTAPTSAAGGAGPGAGRAPLHGPATSDQGPVVTTHDHDHGRGRIHEDEPVVPLRGPRYRAPTGSTGEGAIWRRQVVQLGGWTIRVAAVDARTGTTLLQVWPTDGRPTTQRAAERAVTRVAQRLQDDPTAYRVTVPQSALRTSSPIDTPTKDTR